MIRLSFIVPVFKPKTDVFDKHVKALMAQALKEFEVIWVLDGPCTEARKIIAKYASGQNFQIIEIPHSGAQKARNKGASFAQGELICFLDSDCVIEPGASQMWVEQFDKKPEMGFLYSGYKFFGDKYALDSEPYDPWTLRIRNYISGCFPMRRSLYPGWTEGLESLQDWDMWLSLLEKAEKDGWDISKLGYFVRGYAFTTSYPDQDSISGKGCLPDVWLQRMDAVKSRHNLTDRPVCVSSLSHKHDGITLAKLINADYLDYPNDKPHKYKTIIQIGFSLGADCEKHASIFQEKEVKKFLFWTGENINEIYHATSFKQIDAMSTLLNDCVTQYVEDLEAKRLMERVGFKVQVKPLPLGAGTDKPFPVEKKWLFDISGQYSQVMSVIDKSLPDIKLEAVGNVADISNYMGLIHFFPDGTLSTTMKRAHLTGRHVVSNVQQPFCGFIDDKFDQEKFIVQCVEKIRTLSNKPSNQEAKKFFSNTASELIKEFA